MPGQLSTSLTRYVITLTPSLGDSGGNPKIKKVISSLGDLGTNFVSQKSKEVLASKKLRKLITLFWPN